MNSESQSFAILSELSESISSNGKIIKMGKFIVMTSAVSFLMFSSGVEAETKRPIAETPAVEVDQMVAVIHPLQDSGVKGTISFTRIDDGVRVQAEVSGLDANSRHGFHLHQYGACTSDDGMAAGGHYNPHSQPHAGPMDEQRHMGDLGNLESDENGKAVLDYTDAVISMSGWDTILGRGVIVHERRDDLVSQPVGDAGGRIGCGVIGVGNPG
jgi:superoxide dismutase, Cu-Zn family